MLHRFQFLLLCLSVSGLLSACGADSDGGAKPLPSRRLAGDGLQADMGTTGDVGQLDSVGSDSGGPRSPADTFIPEDSPSPADSRTLADSAPSTDTGMEEDTVDVVEPPDPPPPPSSGSTLYPADRLISPITPSVADTMLELASLGLELQDNVFMKIGASSTASTNTLHCFAGESVDLAAYSALQPTLDFFLTGNADGTTPFDRPTLAAKIGMSVGWALSGSPSPVDAETAAISPRYGHIHYGANDMHLGTTYESAIWTFGERMMDLADHLANQGIIPILWGITPRGDSTSADRWVPTYNAVIRAIAQAKQVPYVNLHLAVQEIPGYGLAGDGLHLNSYYENGKARPCAFTEAGLQHGYNVRNLLALQTLDTIYETLILGLGGLEEPWVLTGEGSPEDPFLIPSLPFSDRRNTLESPYSNLDMYSGCNADQDESGPEYLYRVELTETTRLRAMVFDRGSVDIDVHLLDETASEAGCLERAHGIVQGTFPPGTYTFSLDTFVSSGDPKAGEYLFVLLECHPNDPACAD